ncbi:MAG: hypothetical protein L3J20_10345 [Flavobacteriaceae bacterium]|nr:hypothetical protein [Flavobacteriaceae bacterium]
MKIGIPNIFYTLALVFVLGFLYFWSYSLLTSSSLLDNMNNLLIFFVLVALVFAVMASYFLLRNFKVIVVVKDKLVIFSIISLRLITIKFNQIVSINWYFNFMFTQKTTTRELIIKTINKEKPTIIRCSEIENFNQIVNAIPNTNTQEKNKVYKEHAKRNLYTNIFTFILFVGLLAFISLHFHLKIKISDCFLYNECYFGKNTKEVFLFFLILVLIVLGFLIRVIEQSRIILNR